MRDFRVVGTLHLGEDAVQLALDGFFAGGVQHLAEPLGDIGHPHVEQQLVARPVGGRVVKVVHGVPALVLGERGDKVGVRASLSRALDVNLGLVGADLEDGKLVFLLELQLLVRRDGCVGDGDSAGLDERRVPFG